MEADGTDGKVSVAVSAALPPLPVGKKTVSISLASELTISYITNTGLRRVAGALVKQAGKVVVASSKAGLL